MNHTNGGVEKRDKESIKGVRKNFERGRGDFLI